MTTRITAQTASRRRFLKTALVGAGMAALPRSVTTTAYGAEERAKASNRITVGVIGPGGRGRGDMEWMLGEADVQVVAVCDVRRGTRESAKQAVDGRYGNKDCAIYTDFRELLATRPDIDAMLIATGDRWHALAATLAMKAGKDVFCEKPGSMTVAEGRVVADTARRLGRVFQTGTQRLSEGVFAFATELARTGKLGRLRTVRAHLWPAVQDVTHNAWLPAEAEPPREELDWDLWLGPVPWRPYNHRYLGGCGAWGVYSDMGAGVAGWGSHTIMQCQAAADAMTTSPVEIRFPGNRSGDKLTARYASGVELVLSFEGWRGSCGVRFEGDEGWVSVADGYATPDVSSPALLADYRRTIDDYTARTRRPMSHMRDFLDCVHERRDPVANAEAMHRSMSTNHIINICLALQRDLRWDPAREAFEGDPQANRLLARAAREPWIV